MTSLHPKLAYTISAVAGAIGWVVITQVANRREAWDSELYFSFFLPLLALIVASVAYFAPERAWRWAFAPFGAQAVVAFIQNPTGNLLPLGLVVFAFFGALCLLPAWIGAGVRRRLARSRDPGAASDA